MSPYETFSNKWGSSQTVWYDSNTKTTNTGEYYDEEGRATKFRMPPLSRPLTPLELLDQAIEAVCRLARNPLRFPGTN